MEEKEVMIKYESGNDDDEIERLYAVWKENLQYFDERKLRQHAETLVSDISKFVFDFSSDSQKYTSYGNKFIQMMKSIGNLDDATMHADVYWIHKQLFSNLMLDDDIETYGKYFYDLILDSSADENISKCDVQDAGLIDDLTREYLVARYVMNNLCTCSKKLDLIFNDLRFRNVRSFMDGTLKHGDQATDIFDGLNSLFDINLHFCITENQIFLLNCLLPILGTLDTETLKKILNAKEMNGSNIFHLACEKRIKFLIEELWILIQKAYESDDKSIEKYLLQKNDCDKNAFMLAFQMPLKYTNYDYANEIKNRVNLLNYYRNSGPLEIEMYNFESSLNLIFDIARKNISEKCKKSLIVTQKSLKEKSYECYAYSKPFQDFRCDFLQLRFYCITKISSNRKSTDIVYQFLSRYIEDFMHGRCNDEGIIAMYQKLSFDTFLSDLFKAFVQNNFYAAIEKMTTADNLNQLIETVEKVLNAKDFQKIMEKSSHILKVVISSGDLDKFLIIWNKIIRKNDHAITSLFTVIQNHQYDMMQVLLEHISCNLSEDEIMKSLDITKIPKFIDTALQFYDQAIFDVLINFVSNHFTVMNQKVWINENIVLQAVMKWQESVLLKVLNLIENIFDENEIREFITYKNWEGQTAFHVASKNKNLAQLQMLCKFARYYLSREDFIEVIRAKDKNEYSIVRNDQVSDEVVFSELPKLSNFYSTYPVYVWASLTDLQFPVDAFCIGSDKEGTQLFIAKICENNGSDGSLEIIALSKNTKIDFNEKCVDILCGRGLVWLSKNSEHFAPVRIEGSQTSYIGKILNDVKLVDIYCNQNYEILCTNDTNLLDIEDSSDFIFNRVN